MKRVLSNGLIVLVSLLVTAAIVESVLREFLPMYPDGVPEAFQYDPELALRHRPGIHLFWTRDFQQEIRINHLGTSNFQEGFDDYKYIVFAVGDSFTAGDGVPVDASYPFQLDMLLNLDSRGFYQKRYGVVNLGTGGYGSLQELIALRRWASLIRRPSFILYLGCENDYEDDVLFESGYRHKHIVAGSPTWGRMAGLTQIFTDDLQLGLRLKVLVGLLRQSRIFHEAGLDRAEQERSVAELVSPQLEKILAYAKASGAMLVRKLERPRAFL